MRKKEIIELNIIGVLVLLLLFGAVHAIRGAKRKTDFLEKEQLSKKNSALVSREEKTANAEGLFLRFEKETQNLELIRDPFSANKIISGVSFSHGMYLSGIAWDKEKPRAIINDSIVGIGDAVGDSTVVDIKQDRVILNDGVENFELALE